MFFLLFIYLFISCFGFFVAACGLSLVVASGGYCSLRCVGFSLWWLLLLWSTGSRRAGFTSFNTAGSVVVVHWLCCSAACGIYPDQGSNPCPLHWQADSQPLRHQGSPPVFSSDHQISILHRYI